MLHITIRQRTSDTHTLNNKPQWKVETALMKMKNRTEASKGKVNIEAPGDETIAGITS